MANGKSSSRNNDADPKAKTVAGDDRNLVAIDEAYKEASFEDRLLLFWDKYQKPLIFAATLFLAVIVIWQVIGYVGERMEAKIRAEYAALETSEERLAFAQQRSGHKLSAVAFLELGDEALAEENFSTASEHYRHARERLGNHPFAGRAALGEAFATWQGGDTTNARRLMEAVSAERRYLTAFREEAKLMLAMLKVSEGQWEEARQMVVDLAENSPDQVIQQRAQLVKNGLE